jgi:CRP-like cAMP-binding protein
LAPVIISRRKTLDSKPTHILSGLDGGFVKQLMNLSTTARFKKGAVLFRQGAPATHFYILVNGRAALGVGDPMHTTYIAHTEGEAIGWSCLTGCRNYMASAICIEAATLLKFGRDPFKRLLAEAPDVELKFYQNLSQTLENRLLQSFELLSSLASASGVTSLEKEEIYDPFNLI